MTRNKPVELLQSASRKPLLVNSNILKTSRAIFSNINLLHVRETCAKQLWFTRLIKSM